MELRRVFYPVGNGGFCEETHTADCGKQVHVVYDCGSLNKGLIKKRIDEFKLSCPDPVDLLFLSHFDYDHISGLHHLHRKNGNKGIKRIVMPLLKDAEKQYYLFACLLRDDVQTVRTLSNLLYGHPSNPQITQVSPTILDNDANAQTDIHSLDEIPHNLVGATALHATPSWQYIPFYLKKAGSIPDVRHITAGLKKGFSGLFTNDELNLGYLLENTDRRKKIVKQIQEELKNQQNRNAISMTVYSRPTSDCICTDPGELKGLAGDCLYMGDYDACNNFKALDNMYSRNLNNLGTVQIPHHGSAHSYREELVDGAGMAFVNAAETEHHPASWIIEDIRRKSKPQHLFIVNKKRYTKVQISFTYT